MRLKSKITLAITAVFGTFQMTLAQMVVDDSFTPQQLVQDVLVGEGVSISNVTFSGELSQIGYFDATNANFSIAEGIVMASGNVLSIPAPGGDFANENFNTPGDPDLDIVSSAGTNDAVVLEFDFVPTGDSINFDYVFGSEEYPEFVNAGFNDVFVFIISGPGFSGPFANGGENIALIPGTVTPVTIDNVNDGLNAQYYVDNSAGGADGVIYDGYTVTLTALAQVQCGETYHLKLALADAGDSAYDSGVFLKAGSFSSHSVALEFVATSTSGIALINDTVLVEGCTELAVLLERDNADSVLVTYIDIDGTATQGIDYTGLEDSVVFDIGVDSAWIFVNPVADGITEGNETVIIGITSVDACGNESTISQTFTIVEQGNYIYNLNITAVGEVFCPGDSIVLTAEPDGGIPNFNWLWGNGEQSPTITIFPLGDTTLIVSAIDYCNTPSVTETIDLEIIYEGLPTVQVSNDQILNCPGDQATLTAIGEGFGSLEYSWAHGDVGGTITVTPINTENYIVTVVDDCNATVSDTILVEVVPYSQLELNAEDLSVLCPGDEVELVVSTEFGRAPYSYDWDSGQSTETVTTVVDVTETFMVTITDDCGGEASGDITVTVPVYNLEVTAIPDSIICELGEIVLFADADGGAPGGYAYEWDGQDILSGSNSDTAWVSSTISIETAEDSLLLSYQVRVTDVCDNVAEHTVELWVRDCELITPNVFTPGGDGVNDLFVVTNLDQYPNSSITVYNRWGLCVYESDNYQNDWTGEDYESGVYYYMVFPSDPDIEPINGYVHLIRENN